MITKKKDALPDWTKRIRGGNIYIKQPDGSWKYSGRAGKSGQSSDTSKPKTKYKEGDRVKRGPNVYERTETGKWKYVGRHGKVSMDNTKDGSTSPKPPDPKPDAPKKSGLDQFGLPHATIVPIEHSPNDNIKSWVEVHKDLNAFTPHVIDDATVLDDVLLRRSKLEAGYQDNQYSITAKKGHHWGTAKRDNETARAIAMIGGVKLRPPSELISGEAAPPYKGTPAQISRALTLGHEYKSYAQREVKKQRFNRDKYPEVYRGMTLPPAALSALGEGDSIDLTGCTAFTFEEGVADHYSKSAWTQMVGGKGGIPIKIKMKRSQNFDDSISMWHHQLHSRSTVGSGGIRDADGNYLHPAEEILSSVETMTVEKIEFGEKSTYTKYIDTHVEPETFRMLLSFADNDDIELLHADDTTQTQKARVVKSINKKLKSPMVQLALKKDGTIRLKRTAYKGITFVCTDKVSPAGTRHQRSDGVYEKQLDGTWKLVKSVERSEKFEDLATKGALAFVAEAIVKRNDMESAQVLASGLIASHTQLDSLKKILDNNDEVKNQVMNRWSQSWLPNGLHPKTKALLELVIDSESSSGVIDYGVLKKYPIANLTKGEISDSKMKSYFEKNKSIMGADTFKEWDDLNKIQALSLGVDPGYEVDVPELVQSNTFLNLKDSVIKDVIQRASDQGKLRKLMFNALGGHGSTASRMGIYDANMNTMWKLFENGANPDGKTYTDFVSDTLVEHVKQTVENSEPSSGWSRRITTVVGGGYGFFDLHNVEGDLGHIKGLESNTDLGVLAKRMKDAYDTAIEKYNVDHPGAPRPM